MSSPILKGKTALVTGGGRGIGKAIARRLAEAGATVVIASRKLELLEATAREFATLEGRTIPVQCHAGKREQLEALVKETERVAGPVDILVNNAATNPAQGPALEVTDEAFLKMVELNVMAALRLVRLTVPGMMARGGGAVINISSISGIRPQAGGLAYSFTKAGLIMMTRSWALEFGRHNVRVNAIAPGLIQTDFSEFFWKDDQYRTLMEQRLPLGRIGLPEEVAGLALYLASPESSYVTGQTFVIDGGATVSRVL